MSDAEPLKLLNDVDYASFKNRLLKLSKQVEECKSE